MSRLLAVRVRESLLLLDRVIAISEASAVVTRPRFSRAAIELRQFIQQWTCTDRHQRRCDAS